MKKLFITASVALAMATSAAAMAGSESDAIDMSLYEEASNLFSLHADPPRPAVREENQNGKGLEIIRQQASTIPVTSRDPVEQWAPPGLHLWGKYGPE